MAEITTQENAVNASASEKYKQRIIDYFSNKIKFAATSKKHVYDTIVTIMPNEFIVNPISDELDEVTIISGMEKTVLKFHWKPLESTMYLKRFHLYEID